MKNRRYFIGCQYLSQTCSKFVAIYILMLMNYGQDR